MTNTPDELNQAVSYLKGELADADRHKWLTATIDADDLRLLLSERADLLATVERMRGALEELIDLAEECMGRLDYHDAGMLGDEPIKEARAALTTGEATTPNAGEKG